MERLYTLIFALIAFVTIGQAQENTGENFSGLNKHATYSNPATTIETGKWYLLYQSRNNAYAYNNNGIYYMDAIAKFTSGTLVTTSNYSHLFQFVSTGTDGQYYIMSADGNYFSAATHSAAITASSTSNAYIIAATTNGGGTYFYMLDANSNILIDNNGNYGTVAGWRTTDQTIPTGSTGNNVWRFYEVSFEDYREYLNTAIEIAEQYTISTGLGKYTDPNGTFTTILNEAKAMYEGNSSTDAQYEGKTAELTTAINALTLNMPSTRMYLRLKNKKTGGYITAPEIGNTTSTITVETDKAASSSSIWYYCQPNSSNNRHELLSYSAGMYFNNPAQQTNGLSLIFEQPSNINNNNNANGGYYFANNTTNFIASYLIYNVSGSGWRYLYDTENSETNVIGQNINSGQSNENEAWTLEEVTSLPVTLHVSGTKGYSYGTLYLPVAVKLNTQSDEGTTTAYAATDKGNYVSLSPLSGAIIPKETPVILINENGNTSIHVEVTSETGTAPNENSLSGSYIAKEYNGTDYYLGQDGSTPGLYQVTSYSGYYLTNKAYLSSTSPSKGFAFAFGDDDPTGINGASAENGGGLDVNAPMYNLQGVRVPTWYKGIVVQNGQKYLLK